VRVKLEPGQLDDLDQEVANMRMVLDGEGDTDDLINAAKSLMEEANLFLEYISDESGWKRQHSTEEDES
jgi:hypothetical protein